MPSNHQKSTHSEALVLSHLSGIKRALLEGEKRPAFLEFLRQTDDRGGIYTLYDHVDSTTQAKRPICHEGSINISVIGTPIAGTK